MLNLYQLSGTSSKGVLIDRSDLAQFCARYFTFFSVKPAPRSILVRLPPHLYRYELPHSFPYYEEPTIEIFPSGEAIFTLIPLSDHQRRITTAPIPLKDEAL